MASSRDKQQIEFRGICLSEPFKDQEIEGKINLSVADSVRFSQKSNSNYRESKSDYNRRSSQHNYNDRDDRGSYNDRKERSSSYDRGDSSRNRRRIEEEGSGDGMQLLIVLFGLIFFVNLVAGQLISSSSSSYYETVPPNSQLTTDY